MLGVIESGQVGSGTPGDDMVQNAVHWHVHQRRQITSDQLSRGKLMNGGIIRVTQGVTLLAIWKETWVTLLPVVNFLG